MSNITVAVDEEVLRQAQKAAANKRTTLDALVQGFLEKLAREERTTDTEVHAQARQEILRMLGTFDVKVGSMPTRARTYAER